MLMTNNPIPPVVPGGFGDGDEPNDPVREVDGEEVLDEDANADLIDSADADRLAAEGDES
jgi:hypothetical protein